MLDCHLTQSFHLCKTNKPQAKIEGKVVGEERIFSEVC